MITYEEIRSLVDEGKTPSEIKGVLDVQTSVVNDGRGWKMKDIILHWSTLYGSEAGQSLAGKLSTSLSLLRDANVPFTGESITALSLPTGLSLNEVTSQSMIDFIASQSQALSDPYKWDGDFVTKVKELGIRQELDHPEGVSVEDIQAAIDDEATRIAEQQEAEANRIQSGYVSIAAQAAAATLPGTKAAALQAFTDKLNETWSE